MRTDTAPRQFTTEVTKAPGWHVWHVESGRWPEGLRDVWDECARACDGYVTQTSAWVDYALAVDHRRALLLASFDAQGLPEAVAVGFYVGGRWPLRQPDSLLFPAYPSAREAAAFAAAVERCEQVARRQRLSSLRFLGRAQPDASAAMAPLGYTLQPKLEYVIDLTPGEEALSSGLKRQHRKNVHRSEREDVRVRWETTPEAMHTLRARQEDVARRHSTRGDAFGLRPVAHYDALQRALLAPGLGRIYLACLDDEPVSAALFLAAGHRAMSIYSGSNARGLEAYGEYGLYWQAISHFARAGFTELHFGAADPEAEDPASPAYGLHQFKVGFGAHTRRTAEASKQLSPEGRRV